VYSRVEESHFSTFAVISTILGDTGTPPSYGNFKIALLKN